jgi:hypothetical protein
MVVDDGDDDMDPRTLTEAAARLAHLTSDQVEHEAPRAQWADIYKESGPDGVGAMGSEPGVDLVLVPLAPAPPSGQEDAMAAAARMAFGGLAGAGPAAPPPPRAGPARILWHLSCGASRLLSNEAAGCGLLGLSDDVDLAVVSVRWPSSQQQQQEGSSEPAAAAGAGQPRVVHECYVPALAYVAAGKVHKKHLLLGGCCSTSLSHLVLSHPNNLPRSSLPASPSPQPLPQPPSPLLAGSPHSPISAVMVESQKLYYVYRRTAGRKEQYGMQDMVDMELAEGESVLGARLVEGAGGQALLLLLLTQRHLLVHTLRA